MPSRLRPPLLLAALLASLLASRLAAHAGAQPAPLGGPPGAPPDAPPRPLVVAAEEYAGRRAALLELLGDTTVVVALGAAEPAEDYETFVQASSFAYLTGFREPGAALVLVRRGGARTATLFVEPSDAAREAWTGERAGTEGARRRTGLATRPARDLPRVLDSLAALALPLDVVGDVAAPDAAPTRAERLVDALRRGHPALRARGANGAVAALRGRRSAAELALLRRAAEITARALDEAMRLVEPGLNEFEAQALVEYTFRRNGADRPGFASVVGSGPNATALHYNANDRVMRDGDLVVLDVGASYGGYTADVTRTLPVSGRFTAEQRAVYGVVREAQAAAERAAAPGASWSAVSDSAAATIARGLAALGLVESAAATYECAPQRACPQWQLYYMHALGHGIGLDVHDPDQAVPFGPLAVGSAFTLEPGVYVRERMLDGLPDTPRNRRLRAALGDAVRRYANVGVRIEDDYLVTERGVEWVSRAPREAEEVEAAMRGEWRGPAPRDAALVGAYRRP